MGASACGLAAAAVAAVAAVVVAAVAAVAVAGANAVRATATLPRRCRLSDASCSATGTRCAMAMGTAIVKEATR